MHISRLLFKKGVSQKEGRNESLQWKEVEIEMTLNEDDNPDLARETAQTLFEAWGLQGKVTTRQAPKQAPKQPTTGKKTCAFRGCTKQIDQKYQFCYAHLQEVRRNKT